MRARACPCVVVPACLRACVPAGVPACLACLTCVPAYRDGGDCCPSTCEPSLLHACETANCFQCADPNSTQPCVNSCSSSWNGDGYCDADDGLNRAECSWCVPYCACGRRVLFCRTRIQIKGAGASQPRTLCARQRRPRGVPLTDGRSAESHRCRVRAWLVRWCVWGGWERCGGETAVRMRVRAHVHACMYAGTAVTAARRRVTRAASPAPAPAALHARTPTRRSPA
jgi:hypothetical protein